MRDEGWGPGDARTRRHGATGMRIFELSKNFPPEERYSLTDQIRRSSRSVCTNIGEAWRKRRYPAHFVSKMSDSEGELKKLEYMDRDRAAMSLPYIPRS